MIARKKRFRREQMRKLEQKFVSASASASVSGKARTWFVPYLAEVLKTYVLLQSKKSGERIVRRCHQKKSRRVLRKLLRSAHRDTKTRSRWSAVLAHALSVGIEPEDLPLWLKSGGGISGRAAEIKVVK